MNPATTATSKAPSSNGGLQSLIPGDLRKLKATKRMRAVVKFMANPIAETRRKNLIKADKKEKAEIERLAEWDGFLQSGRRFYEAGQN